MIEISTFPLIKQYWKILEIKTSLNSETTLPKFLCLQSVTLTSIKVFYSKIHWIKNKIPYQTKTIYIRKHFKIVQKYLLQTHLHCNIIWKLCLYKYIGCIFLFALVVKHIKQQCEYRKQGIRNIFILVIIIVIMIKVLSSSTFTKDKAAITKYFYFRITTITVCLNIQLKKNLYQSFKVMWVDKFCTYL